MTQEVDSDQFQLVGENMIGNAKDFYDAFAVNVRVLGQTGSMAGTDDAATAWAASYDERAAEVLGAVNDFIAAMENYGGVVIQVGHNHAVAEHHSTPGATGPPPAMPQIPVSGAGTLAAPPAAGGPGQGLIDGGLGLVGQIGIPVPDGDTDKLDTAAQAWDRLATVYDATRIIDALDAQASVFRDNKTPEDDYIARDIGELRTAARVILDGCAELAQSCRDYKSALDELRTQIEDFLRSLAIELAIDATVTVAASFLTFGASVAAGVAKAAATITRFAIKIRKFIGAWKASKRIAAGVDKIAEMPGRILDRLKNMRRKGNQPKLGKGVSAGPGIPMTTTRAQIEAKFKHASDFGVTEPRGKAGFYAFENAVKSHVDDPSTLHVNGSYHNAPSVLNYNPKTGLVVVQTPTGEFVSGWRVSLGQAQNILERGKLGGG